MLLLFFILGNILLFYPANSSKNKNFKKKEWKKAPGDITILHKCTKNHDYMLYYSWDMARDKYDCCFLFWVILCPFTPLTARRVKVSKKWKKHLEISSFSTSVLKIIIVCYTVLEIWRVTDIIVVFHFGQFFVLLLP